jgi:nucleoid-associated protein YgaU
MPVSTATTTRGGLVPATITECEKKNDKVKEKSEESGGLVVRFMFNPTEYTVTKENSYDPKFEAKASAPNMTFTEPKASTLSLSGLIFDSYEEKTPTNPRAKPDVTQKTNVLFKLMNVDSQTLEPPPVVFEWGVFKFYAVITKVTQKFTLFDKDGTPLRAEVSVDLTQHRDLTLYPKQNPSSGDGPLDRVWLVRLGDRLDLIANETYGDATKWRLIAAHNGLRNPLQLRAGQSLRIPEE